MNDEDEFEVEGDPQQDEPGEGADTQSSDGSAPRQISPETAEALKDLGLRAAEVQRAISEPITAYITRYNEVMGSSMASAIAAQMPKLPIVQLPVSKSILESLTANLAGPGLAAAALARMSIVPTLQLPMATIPPMVSPSLLESLTANLTRPAAGIAASMANAIPPGTFDYSGLLGTSGLTAGLSSLVTVPSPVDTFWASPGFASMTASLTGPGPYIHESLSRITGLVGSLYNDEMLRGFDVLRSRFREWIPENLRGVSADRWMWLLRISTKEGICLAFAPRADIVEQLLVLPHSQDRRSFLLDRGLDVVEDVEASLKEVDHPDLDDLKELTLQAADCIRDGRDAPAQALLGNVLDTAMRAHGHTWLRSSFPQANFLGTGSHKMLAGAHGTSTGDLELRMLVPSMLAAGLKNAFGDAKRQDTFNRHLGAHKASAHSYRTEFALTALLNTQALLRVLDRYLYANAAP